MSSTTLPVCPKTGSTSPSLTVHLCLHTVPGNRECARYGRLGGTRSFQKGLDRVTQGMTSHRIALMCAEKEPLECHRGLLVAPALEARGVSVAHIGPDGRLEPHADAMRRLLALHGMQDAIESQRLFPRSRAERITEALSQQAHRFAHRNESLTNDSTPPGRRNGELQT